MDNVLGLATPDDATGEWGIEFEEHHSSSTNWGETNNNGVLEAKMLTPGVLAWVEQGHNSLQTHVWSNACAAMRKEGRIHSTL